MSRTRLFNVEPGFFCSPDPRGPRPNIEEPRSQQSASWQVSFARGSWFLKNGGPCGPKPCHMPDIPRAIYHQAPAGLASSPVLGTVCACGRIILWGASPGGDPPRPGRIDHRSGEGESPPGLPPHSMHGGHARSGPRYEAIPEQYAARRLCRLWDKGPQPAIPQNNTPMQVAPVVYFKRIN